jgi:WD40 repeat protein
MATNADQISSSRPDTPSIIHALNPQTLLLATDSSALHFYDLRASQITSKPQATHHPHSDYISSLTALPPSDASTSGYSKQFVTTGGTTLAVTDLRRGVLVKSDDQEEELLSSCIVSGVGKRGKGEKILVGTGSGVVTLWEKGSWQDQEGRIIMDKGGESLDSLAVVGGEGNVVAVGLGDGRIRFVKVGQNKVIRECIHDEIEGVLGLGFEVGGRMISGGGGIVKVWQGDLEESDEEVEAEEQEERNGVNGVKRSAEGDSEEDSGEDEESSEEEERVKRKKKRKKGNGKARGDKKQVMAFKGMD